MPCNTIQLTLSVPFRLSSNVQDIPNLFFPLVLNLLLPPGFFFFSYILVNPPFILNCLTPSAALGKKTRLTPDLFPSLFHSHSLFYFVFPYCKPPHSFAFALLHISADIKLSYIFKLKSE